MMENVLVVAAYVFNRYREMFGQKIDEMKLHKMLYFAQRESLIQNDRPLFEAAFSGWKYGPVLKEIRSAYREESFSPSVSPDVVCRIKPIVDKVFEDYAERDSWSLSRLTHGEISWKNSREGIPPNENGDIPLELEDIRLDAARVKERRELLGKLGLL